MDIAYYTAERWGRGQAREYAARLDECFVKIVQGTAFHRRFSDKFPQLLVTRCEHHHVFFIYAGNGRPRIIAILHERMELIARLNNRLD